jgi:3'(2'), 5'-bisphosphate nucleotidase
VLWRLRERMDIQLVRIGSAGAKAMAVVRGDVDAYVHAGGQWEWDSAAPAGVVQAAGLHASRLDGSPLIYNRRDPYLPDLLMCRAELAGVLLDGILSAYRER